MSNSTLHIISHPCAKELMTMLRSHDTQPDLFRATVTKLGHILALQATQGLSNALHEITTGTGTKTTGYRIATQTALVPVLRAGLSLVDPFFELLPRSYIWHVGMGRDEHTLQPKLYSNAIPNTLPLPNDRIVYVLDTMLATGGTAVAVIDLLKARNAKRVVFVGVLAAPEGVARIHEAHPDVEIHLAALDDHLTSRGYIIPGLGDAGDRLFPKV
jgi:uracil phosphoribosyltransferase